ncbi:MAG: hypothetical protein VX733_11340 [Candidatus Latescibacterota bacterium]|nr:hypothetical protein [Candidatus Latescibacterota bacterium]
MTSQVSEEPTEEATRPRSTPVATSASVAGLQPLTNIQQWTAEFRDGLTGETEAVDDGLSIRLSGAGELVILALAPIPVNSASAFQVWLTHSWQPHPENLAQAVLLLSNDSEIPLGDINFAGTHLLHRSLPSGSVVTGISLRNLFSREGDNLVLRDPALVKHPPALGTSTAVEGDETPSMIPVSSEEVTNRIEKDGISFVLEARSLSAVLRYVYTPIEGNLSDIEVEINNGDAIKLSEDGGVTVEMEGVEWSAEDEEIERHFVSCEQVDDCVEARWQFRRGSELADFRYRLRVQGKSLLIELDGGNARATGVELGYVVGAVHPRLIKTPFFNIGEDQPTILSTSGVFVSSYIDWYSSGASSLHGEPLQNDELMHLNGGCRYRKMSDGRRAPLQERWVLTVSRRFEEVLPNLNDEVTVGPQVASDLVWCQLPEFEANEEAYVEAYERLRMYRQIGMDKLLVLHPASMWNDGVGGAALRPSGSPAKGGDDALTEYLEAVEDLGYPVGLHSSFREISPADPDWKIEAVALDEYGELARSGPGRYLMRPTTVDKSIAGLAGELATRFDAGVIFLGDHCAQPPWTRFDYDHRLDGRASFRTTLSCDRRLLRLLADDSRPVVADGGSHWWHAGRVGGVLARPGGQHPSQQPLLVDFALRRLRPGTLAAGLGTPTEFFGGEIAEEERDGRSPKLDRYLAATVAYGHAGLLPNLEEWGLCATAKVYYMLQALQQSYLGVNVQSVHYHCSGNFLEISEALVAGTHENSQVRIVYENGLQIYVNGAEEEEWTITLSEDDEIVYKLPPASFLANGPGDLLVYSADPGDGRIDYARCADYLFLDTRGRRLSEGSITLSGAALLTHQDWQIDVYPLDCEGEIEIRPGMIWENRRMPPLRVLAYRDDEGEDLATANISEKSVVIRVQDDVYRYRITLPEWMVEPGK